MTIEGTIPKDASIQVACVTAENVDSIWRPRPDPEVNSPKPAATNPEYLTDAIDGVNTCAVDPVAVLKLQVATVSYFSSPKAQKRIMDSIAQ